MVLPLLLMPLTSFSGFGGFLPPPDPPALSTSCLHSPVIILAGLPSRLLNVQPFNLVMQDRYGLLTNPRSPNTLVTTSDFDFLVAFRLRLQDSDRWVVDRWIVLLRLFLNSSSPDLLASSHSITSSTYLVISRPSVATSAPSLTLSLPLRLSQFLSVP